MKNKQKYSFTDETVEANVTNVTVESKTHKENKVYVGAEWIGAELISPVFGKLEKGKIYPLTEDVAKISSGFKPIYK